MAKVILHSLLTVLLFSSVQIISAQTTNSSQLDYELAIRVLEEGSYAEALEKFDQLIYSGFDNKEIYKYRGVAKFRLDDFRGAAEDLDKVRDNEDEVVIGLLGICKYLFQEKEAAKYFLTKATAAGFTESKGHLYLGYLYSSDLQYEEAVAQLNLAEKSGEKESQLFKIRGIAAYYSGDTDLAIQDLNKTIVSEKLSLEVYEALGLAYADKKDFKKGINFLQKADSLGSKNSKVFFNLGRAWHAAGKYSEEVDAYDKAIALNYAGSEVYINRGNAKVMSGRVKESLSDFDFAIKLNPETTLAYRGRVEANLLLKDWARVITDLAIVNALGSVEPSDWGVLSEAKLALKNYQGALDEANTSLAKGTTHYTLEGKEHSVYLQKGKCLIALGKFEDALEALSHVEANESGFALYTERAGAYVGLDQFEKAIGDLEKAQLKYPKSSILFYNSAVIKEELKDFGAAVLDYNKAISLNPSDAAAYFGRGNSKALKGETAAAINDIDKAIELDSNNAIYYKVRANFHYQMKNKEKACFDWRKAGEYGDQKARFSIDQYCNNK